MSTSLKTTSNAAWAVGSWRDAFGREREVGRRGSREHGGEVAPAYSFTDECCDHVLVESHGRPCITRDCEKRVPRWCNRIDRIAGHAASSHARATLTKAMECLEADVMQRLMANALVGVAKRHALDHLDSCGVCRECLAIMARDATLVRRTDVVEHDVAPRRPTSGHVVGRYTLVEKLGSGAMGVVWSAEDPKLERKVALKLLKRRDVELTERLIREARSMAQVAHPNVVAVFEVDVADDATFITMELVAGQSLRKWQATDRAVPDVVAAYVEAGRGLAAAHAAGIVHRDFKADNVLVGNDGRIRVTDFGLALAKPISEDTLVPRDVQLTTTGSVMGTPAYMAPEQFAGGNVDSRTDQFNFCASLYEALYRERAFDGRTFEELRANVVSGRFRRSSRASGGLCEILHRGMSIKPGDRYATMEHLLVELGRDRARPWRLTATVNAAFAVILAIGLVADWAVRAQVASESRQSFALTGTELEKTIRLHIDEFYTVSAVAYREDALRQLAGHHDQADFGLGTAAADREDLEKLHDTLLSTEWVKLRNSDRAIADYKGRLLYTSAAPRDWGQDLSAIPAIKRVFDGAGDSITVESYADPVLVRTGILGKGHTSGLAIMFARTLELGDKTKGVSEARAIYLQFENGNQLLDDVRLDRDTLLALVSVDGTTTGDAGALRLVEAAPSDGAIVDVSDGGHRYRVQSRPVFGLDSRNTIARLVMARRADGVLQLFPGARIVFALMTLLTMLLFGYAARRARKIVALRT